MFKKRYFSIHSDFKTGFFCKLFFFVGLILLIISIILIISSFLINEPSNDIFNQLYELSNSTIPYSLLALSLISFAIGIIMYWFNCQFAKLEEIAKSRYRNTARD